MTWRNLVAHVCNTNQNCDEREARRQIGNAIADRKLFPRWADKPVIPPMPGSNSFWVPWSFSGPISLDDTPPTDAKYWLECEIDATDPDRVLEPPEFVMVNESTAAQLDKMRRFRKPVFNSDHVFHCWPIVKDESSDTATAKSVFREDVETEYKGRIEAFNRDEHRYPSRDEDQKWGKGKKVGRDRIRQLREKYLPLNVRRGGAPKKNKNMAKNNLAAKLPC
jgi:hypothetical protein